MTEKVSGERLRQAIGREGTNLSSSQENRVTRWIESETSKDVVPRDHRERCAVHFINEDAEEELQNKLAEAPFHYNKWSTELDDWDVTGSGLIVTIVEND